jgi:hypothetical protein
MLGQFVLPVKWAQPLRQGRTKHRGSHLTVRPGTPAMQTHLWPLRQPRRGSALGRRETFVAPGTCRGIPDVLTWSIVPRDLWENALDAAH